MKELDKYLRGEVLYGDDFTEEEIKQWYNEEEEAYADLYGKNNSTTPQYGNHKLNMLYGFNYLKDKTFNNVLGFGSSWGYEFLPVIDKINHLTIVESSSQTVSKQLGSIIPEYHKPHFSGKLDFPDNSFDLITCFDVLHHIPNVTFVLNELFRVLKIGGFILIREPINSMGDWRVPRNGLTKNERGIPDAYLSNIIHNASITVCKRHYYSCMTCFLNRTFKLKFINGGGICTLTNTFRVYLYIIFTIIQQINCKESHRQAYSMY